MFSRLDAPTGARTRDAGVEHALAAALDHTIGHRQVLPAEGAGAHPAGVVREGGDRLGHLPLACLGPPGRAVGQVLTGGGPRFVGRAPEVLSECAPRGLAAGV
ncbi:MAG: hypothetical protein HY332_10190 [Chloroflexi bacterium]|nr:hypothetical protein [Chloroflexota bacterium]